MQNPASVGQTPRILPFRWILPLGQLVLSLLLASMVMELRRWLPTRLVDGVLEAVAVLNLPGGLIQLPFDALHPGRPVWRPPFIDYQLWRAFTWPFLGAVFWWMAGRATEALLSLKFQRTMPKIGWIETVTGFLLMAAGATLLGGMLFSVFTGDRDPIVLHLGAAGGLWALLGSLSVIARFRQSRLRPRQANPS